MSVFRLLCMCTANQCRSPMAEVLAANQLMERGVDAVVVSSGMLDGGKPATNGSVNTMRTRGFDLSLHQSRQIDPDTIGAADLILTMERRHLTAIAELDVDAVVKSFPLKELAELAPIVGWRSTTVSVSDWVRQANALRLPGSVLSRETQFDVADPMGGSKRNYAKAADEISELLETVFRFLFPVR
jgi:protein-tyrosine phosphatase